MSIDSTHQDVPPSRPTPHQVIGLRWAAPAWLAGWAVMRLGGSHGPNPGWDVAHSVWIVAFGLFGAAALGLRRLAGTGRGPAAALVTALAGAAALIVQMAIDLVVGLLSADHQDMSRRYDDVFAVPGVHLVCYQVAPALLFVGLLWLATAAWRGGRLTGATTILLYAGVLATALGKPAPGWLRVIEGLGAAVIGVGLTRAAGSRTPGPVPAAGSLSRT